METLGERIDVRRWVGCGVWLVALCLLWGCQNFEPPVRPVAYVFPTIRGMEFAENATEREVTAGQVRSWLERGGVWRDLVTAGMGEAECELIIRGLRRGGYAELDLRKCGLPLQWVSVRSFGERRIELLIGYDLPQGTERVRGMMRMDKIPEDTIRRSYVAGKTIVGVWRGTVGGTEREYVALAPSLSRTPRPDFWLKRLVFDTP